MEIRNYINERYDRWLDYSTYHCNRSGLKGHDVDLLNEVLISLLEKPKSQLMKLYEKKKPNGYRDIDYFVLRMIKLNATSKTAPYRWKNKPVPYDENTDYSELEIEDIQDNDEDRAGNILDKMNIVREALEDIEPHSDPLDIEAFYFRHFDGEPGRLWKEGSDKDFYKRANKTLEDIKVFVENVETRRLKVKAVWYSFAG